MENVNMKKLKKIKNCLKKIKIKITKRSIYTGSAIFTVVSVVLVLSRTISILSPVSPAGLTPVYPVYPMLPVEDIDVTKPIFKQLLKLWTSKYTPQLEPVSEIVKLFY